MIGDAEWRAKRAEYSKEWRRKNRTWLLKEKRRYHRANRNEINARKREIRKTDRVREQARIWSREYRKKHIDEVRRNAREWVRRHPQHNRFSSNKRRATKLRAIPKWADMNAIKKIYRKAAETGMHVDHIVPLVHPLVCGLHVENNLQLLTPSQNFSKNNR